MKGMKVEVFKVKTFQFMFKLRLKCLKYPWTFKNWKFINILTLGHKMSLY